MTRLSRLAFLAALLAVAASQAAAKGTIPWAI